MPATRTKQPVASPAKESMELLNTQEAADFLGVPEATMRHWRHVQKGPKSIRIGRHVRYVQAQLEEYVQQLMDAEDAQRSQAGAA